MIKRVEPPEFWVDDTKILCNKLSAIDLARSVETNLV
jgi:hypothetical protein